MTDGGKRRRPMHFSPDDGDEQRQQADTSMRAPRALPAEAAEVVEPDFTVTEQAPHATAQRPAAVPAPRHWPLRLLLAALSLLAALAAGLAIDGLLRAAFARADWLGWVAATAVALGAAGAAALAVRELLGWWRLRRVERLRGLAQAAVAEPREASVAQLQRALLALYGRRSDMRWALARLREHDVAVLDPAERLQLLELEVLQPLDRQAKRLILRAARDVAGLTAIAPSPALDVIIVALHNLRMLRQLAALYGGRPGWLGGWKLARMVLAHLALTGALAVGDALLPHVLGKGLAGRLSARFGEGVVNGVLTARIGLAALDFVRPMPFAAAARPGLKDLARRLTE